MFWFICSKPVTLGHARYNKSLNISESFISVKEINGPRNPPA